MRHYGLYEHFFFKSRIVQSYQCGPICAHQRPAWTDAYVKHHRENWECHTHIDAVYRKGVLAFLFFRRYVKLCNMLSHSSALLHS